MTFVEGVPPSKHFRCITQRYVLRSPITQPNIPEEQVAYRQFPRPSPLPRRRGYARLHRFVMSRSKRDVFRAGIGHDTQSGRIPPRKFLVVYTKPPTFSALFFSLTRTATRQTCLPGSRRSWRDERARQVARLVSWSAGLASGALMPGAEGEGDGGRRYL